MVHVGQDLVVGVGVNRRHDAVLHADLLVQRLDQRREAIGRAGRVRDDLVRGFEDVVIHAVNDRLFHAGTTRCRNDDLLRAARDVLAGRFRRAEQARALVDDVDAEIAPRQLRRVTLGEDLDAITVDDDIAAVHFDGAVERAVRRIVARQVRVGFGITEVVERDYVEFVGTTVLVDSTYDVASDAAVAIDTNLDSHVVTPVLNQ